MGFAEDLIAFQQHAGAAFMAALGSEAVELERVRWLGRNGRLKELQDVFRLIEGDDKRQAGTAFNAAKAAVEVAWRAASERSRDQGDGAAIDMTWPGNPHQSGALHPLSRIAQSVEHVFSSMGFAVVDGPHVEYDHYNFSRLNIPPDHPARDAQDTFWLTDGRCLRTHTSAVQSRFYEAVGQGKRALPLRCVVVGRVFRYEAVDATHDNTFTQVEGFVVDAGITVADMIGTIRTMLNGVLGRDDIEVRLRPAFYPFVEPGFDVDIRSPSAPKDVRYHDWMELMGCGMIHPQVLSAGGIDASRWNGFAFGLGLERLAMVRHGIADIRVFHGGDVRSLRQLAAG